MEQAYYAKREPEHRRCVAIESGLHQAGRHGVGSDAGPFEPARKGPGKHSITGLGLLIRFLSYIGPPFELEVGEIKITRIGRCDVDDACGRTRPKEIKQIPRQDVIAEHVGGKGKFQAVNADLPPDPIDAGIVDEHIEAGISFTALPCKFVYGLLIGSINVQHRRIVHAGAAHNLIGGSLAASNVAATQYEFCAEGRDLNGDLFTNARGGTGNDDSLACHGRALGLFVVHVIYLRALAPLPYREVV